MINSETFENEDLYKIRQSYNKIKKDNPKSITEKIIKGMDHNHFGDYMLAFYGDLRV